MRHWYVIVKLVCRLNHFEVKIARSFSVLQHCSAVSEEEGVDVNPHMQSICCRHDDDNKASHCRRGKRDGDFNSKYDWDGTLESLRQGSFLRTVPDQNLLPLYHFLNCCGYQGGIMRFFQVCTTVIYNKKHAGAERTHGFLHWSGRINQLAPSWNNPGCESLFSCTVGTPALQ